MTQVQPDLFPSHVPRSVGMKRVLDHCKDRFTGLPGGRPATHVDLGAICLLAAIGENAARVQLVKLGLDRLSFTDERREQIMGWYAAQEDIEIGGSFAPVRTTASVQDVDGRLRQLWDGVLRTWGELKREADAVQERIAPLLPEGWALDDHQLEAVALAIRMDSRALIADEMGLGKTVEALGLALWHGEDVFPLMIVCPSSVVWTWKAHVEEWLQAFDPQVRIVGTRFKASGVEGVSNLVLVASYDQMTGYQHELLRCHPRMLIFDESHYLQNWDSQRSKAAIRVRLRSLYRLCMTGTPMPNGRHREYFTQLKVLDASKLSEVEGKGGEYTRFKWRYCGPKVMQMGEKTIKTFDGRSNAAEFGQLLQDYVIRRTKAEAGMNLPEKTRYAIEVPLTRKQRLALARVEDEIRADVQERARELELELAEKGYPDHVIAERVRQILASEVIRRTTQLRIVLGQMKGRWSVTRIAELVEEGHRVLVFCYHRDVARIVAEACEERFGKGQVLWGTGEMPPKKRKELVDRGQAGEGKVIVLTRAFREGITLTAYDRGCMVERWWVPGEEIQGEDRIHRRGQTSDVAWDYLVSQGTIDDRMTELVTWKERGQQDSYGSSHVRVLQWLMEEK